MPYTIRYTPQMNTDVSRCMAGLARKTNPSTNDTTAANSVSKRPDTWFLRYSTYRISFTSPLNSVQMPDQ